MKTVDIKIVSGCEYYLEQEIKKAERRAENEGCCIEIQYSATINKHGDISHNVMIITRE